MDSFAEVAAVVSGVIAGLTAAVFLISRALRRPKRSVGKHPALGMGYGPMHIPGGYSTIVLTPRMLQLVNEARRRFGYDMLTERGFRRVIWHGLRVRESIKPVGLTDWLTFLILFEVDDMRLHARESGLCAFCIFVTPEEVDGLGPLPHSAGRPSHWSCRDHTPARLDAKRIVDNSPPYDPYTALACSISGHGRP